LPSLGADQFDENDPKEASQLSSFFNWFLFSITIGAILGVTIIVWISTNQGWDLGFGVCAIAVLLAIIFASMGKSLYRNNVPKGSPLTSFAQVTNNFVKSLYWYYSTFPLIISLGMLDKMNFPSNLLINVGICGCNPEPRPSNSREGRRIA
jgi:dipeptide/tripeptide permease